LFADIPGLEDLKAWSGIGMKCSVKRISSMRSDQGEESCNVQDATVGIPEVARLEMEKFFTEKKIQDLLVHIEDCHILTSEMQNSQLAF
jgi:hypothetical protein